MAEFKVKGLNLGGENTYVFGMDALDIIKIVYPIGSIYLAGSDVTQETIEEEMFPGTRWELVGTGDDYLRAVSAGAGQTGGSNYIAPNNIPYHSHTVDGIGIRSGNARTFLRLQGDSRLVQYGEKNGVSFSNGALGASYQDNDHPIHEDWQSLEIGGGNTSETIKTTYQSHYVTPRPQEQDESMIQKSFQPKYYTVSAWKRIA